MRQTWRIVTAMAVMAIAAVPAGHADERADWGVTVAVGAEDSTLLLRNNDGLHLVVVDAFAAVRGAGLGAMTLSDIRPGDRVDYAASPWAGTLIADALHVTPWRRAEARPR